jgi:heme A synthase
LALPWRPIQIASGTLLAAAFLTMMLGAFVKAIGAGMSCPEWPTCQNGAALPPLSSAGVTAEIFHRIAATTVVVAGLALLYLEFAQYRAERKLRNLTYIAAILVGIQIALGALTITSNLQPFIVTAHLTVATLIFGFSLVIAQRAWKLPPAAAAPAPQTGAAPDSAKSG